MDAQLSYSVLMSVYAKEKPDYLREAMESIWAQTAATDDFVLVCDGPLTPELETVIAAQTAAHPETLHIVRLEKNEGLGRALNVGIRECRHDLVARMDSDDISRPDRCRRQLDVFAAHPEISVVSGTVEEFSVSREQVETRRRLPESAEEIRIFARRRNPFNHPCVMYRKSAVEAAGGYRDFYLLEDYYLWVRMLKQGAKGRNLPEPLLWMRAGPAMYRRRSGPEYARSQRALFREMRDMGFITGPEYCLSAVTRTVSAMLPNGLRELAFKILLRKK